MRFFTFSIIALLLTTMFAAVAPVASAKPDLPPLVGYCTQATEPGCDGAVCVGFSRQIPVCVDGEFDAAPVSTKDICVEYMYVADYHWYWACANPADADCMAYTKEQHGNTVTRECVVGAPTVQATASCVFVAQDLDYSHYVCVALGDTSCPVYTLRTSGGHSQKTCVL